MRVHISAFLLRLITGALFVIHGYPKLATPELFVQFFADHGIPGGAAMVTFLGVVEFLGGILLIVGLLTRASAFVLMIDMFVALFAVELREGFALGAQFATLLFTTTIVLLVLGAGFISIDQWVRGHRPLLARFFVFFFLIILPFAPASNAQNEASPGAPAAESPMECYQRVMQEESDARTACNDACRAAFFKKYPKMTTIPPLDWARQEMFACMDRRCPSSRDPIVACQSQLESFAPPTNEDSQKECDTLKEGIRQTVTRIGEIESVVLRDTDQLWNNYQTVSSEFGSTMRVLEQRVPAIAKRIRQAFVRSESLNAIRSDINVGERGISNEQDMNDTLRLMRYIEEYNETLRTIDGQIAQIAAPLLIERDQVQQEGRRQQMRLLMLMKTVGCAQDTGTAPKSDQSKIITAGKLMVRSESTGGITAFFPRVDKMEEVHLRKSRLPAQQSEEGIEPWSKRIDAMIQRTIPPGTKPDRAAAAAGATRQTPGAR